MLNRVSIRGFLLTLALTLATLLMLPSSSFSSDYHSPRTDALGGAGHAGPFLSDAIYLNPSYAPFVKTHALSVNYLKFGGGTLNAFAGPGSYYGHNLNFAVLDGTPDTLFQAGVGYTRRDDTSILHVSAGKKLGDRVSVGIGAKFLFPNDNLGLSHNDGSLSTSVIITEWLQASVIADNLLETATRLGFYREYTLGTKLNLKGLALFYIDPHLVPTLPLALSSNQSTFGIQAGAEFNIMSDFYLRVGAFQNSTVPFQGLKGDGFGTGLGWVGPKLSLDYGFSRVINPISSHSHQFGVTVFF